MDDYLWDKTGEDADIEALENSLQAFRFQADEPPALPQKVFTVEKSGWRNIFRLGFAFASLASVVIAFSLFRFGFGDDKIPAFETIAKTGEFKRVEKIARDSLIAPRQPTPPTALETAPPDVRSNIVKVRRKATFAARPLKAISRKPKPKETFETLTAEERYAYNQLMLALSITGTQLKIVKDKVQGIEDQNAALETAK